MQNEFAELLGAFAGDGWISKGNTARTLFITGNPKDEKAYYNRVSNLFSSIFGVKVLPRDFKYWKTYGIMTSNKIVIDGFIEAGMSVGKKATSVKVPNQILENKVLQKNFLRGLFDTDGCIYFEKSYNENASKWQKSNRHLPIIEIKTVSKELAYQIRQILENYRIKSRIKENCPKNTKWSKSYGIKIAGKNRIKQFFATFEPKNRRHLDKFAYWLEKGFY